MAAPLPSGDNIFEKLGTPTDSAKQARHEQAQTKRVSKQYDDAQHRLAELIDSNTTLPVTISSVTVLNAPNTRRGFLKRIFDPLVSKEDNQFYTLTEALSALSANVDKLSKFDIFHAPISTFIDRPDPTNASTTPTDLDVYVSVREKSRVVASSGTWAGSNDGSVYLNVLLRNMLGGAETLNANASFGTRTRSAYSADISTPLFSNPDLRFELGGLQSATAKAWASHDERLRGGFTRIKWLSPEGHRHDFAYSGMWRQVTNLAESASATVRADAGDSFKSSISHSWTADGRNNPLLPTSGQLLRTNAEIAGLGPLGGDVAFAKLEAESQSNIPIPIPFADKDLGISLTASLRAGLLYPLSLAGGKQPTQSRINDRFFLGGPTDVRGFRFSGLGPHDQADAVGGDVFAAGGLSLFAPFPRVGKESPLRLLAFVNGGRLLSLRNVARQKSSTTGNDGMSSNEVSRAVGAAIQQLGDGLPSLAAGVGVVYALPVARFELNFSLPIVMRRGEEARKGVQLGVGISFL